jgi:hypothetical protein
MRVAGERSKCARRLRRRIDVGNSRYVERDGGRQDDEVGRDVGVEHSALGVPPDAAEFRDCRTGVAHEWRVASFCLHVLDLLGRLPEEKVRTYGGTEDADDHSGGFGIRRETRPDRAERHLTPGDVYREQDRGVGQQRER